MILCAAIAFNCKGAAENMQKCLLFFPCFCTISLAEYHNIFMYSAAAVLAMDFILLLVFKEFCSAVYLFIYLHFR